MTHGNLNIEQVTLTGDVALDKDESKSRKELIQIIKDNTEVHEMMNGFCIIEFNNKKIAIYVKNVTYLGTPHPIYKKRIQLGKNFIKAYDEFKQLNINLMLLGVYTYKDTLVFVDFEIENYIKNKGNNSSAHVFVSDLQMAFEKNIYSKTDHKNNEITCIKGNGFSKYLKDKYENNGKNIVNVFNKIDEFFNSLNIEWIGKSCYKEMIDNNFNNKFQSEWPGFYLEFKLDKFVAKHKLENYIKYEQNKRKGEVDLDLFFPEVQAYGDLKCHTSSGKGIPGNDMQTILNVTKTNSIYYVICEHETTKDKELNYETTKYWNEMQNKNDLMSYHTRMKGKVNLKSYMILEINKYNLKYLSSFQKDFINSDGSKRKEKIIINKKDISNFIVYKKEL